MGYTNKIGNTTITDTVIRIDVGVCWLARTAELIVPTPLFRTMAARELA